MADKEKDIIARAQVLSQIADRFLNVTVQRLRPRLAGCLTISRRYGKAGFG